MSRGEGILNRAPRDAKRACVNKDLIMSLSDRNDTPNHPGLSLWFIKGREISEGQMVCPPWEKECSGLKQAGEARQRPLPSVSGARRRARFCRLR